MSLKLKHSNHTMSQPTEILTATIHPAKAVCDAATNHLETLIRRHWDELGDLLEDAEEVTVSAKIVITSRDPEIGEHPDKDNRVKTTISFSKKVSDSMDSALNDPRQPELDLDSRPVNTIAPAEPRTIHPHAVTAEDNGDGTGKVVASFSVGTGGLVTSLADKLAQAAAGKPLPRVKVDFPDGFNSNKYRSLFRKAAKKQGWPEVCIDIIEDVADEAAWADATTENPARALDVLRAHSEPKTASPDNYCAAVHVIAEDRAEELADTFDASNLGEQE